MLDDPAVQGLPDYLPLRAGRALLPQMDESLQTFSTVLIIEMCLWTLSGGCASQA